MTGSLNPVANSTQRDPSSAWKTKHGEWRFVNYNSSLWSSRDFLTWSLVGQQTEWALGECPSFFVLPRSTPGAGPLPNGTGAQPTHVYKRSNAWSDAMQVGVYVDGAPGRVGKWTPSDTHVVNPQNTLRGIDGGALYAAKDMIDPVKGRRIYWGWTAYVAPGQGLMSLPRELTWNPELQQLVHSSLPEMDKLRKLPAAAKIGAATLDAAVPVPLSVPVGVGAQAEVFATFQLPPASSKSRVLFGVTVMAGIDALLKTGMLFWFENCTLGDQPRACTVGSTNVSISSLYTPLMHGLGIMGSRLPNTTNTSTFTECREQCLSQRTGNSVGNSECVAWSHNPSQKPGSSGVGTCSSYNAISNTAQTIWDPPPTCPNCTSGVLRPSLATGGRRDTLQLSPTDTNVTIRVFVDHTMAEGFWQGGRVAMTRQVDGNKSAAAMALYSDTAGVEAEAEAWAMEDCWITKEELLATPRLDAEPGKQ